MITYSAGMPKCEEVRTVGTVPAPTPMFGVYYDLETNKLYTRPVICFTIREFLNRSVNPMESYIKAYPVCYSKDINQMVEEDTIGGNTGFIGLTEDTGDPKTGELKKEEWQALIRDYKKKNKASGE